MLLPSENAASLGPRIPDQSPAASPLAMEPVSLLLR